MDTLVDRLVNKANDAGPTINGFVFQFVGAALHCLEMKPGGKVELEKAEDVDVYVPCSKDVPPRLIANLLQYKHYRTPVTISSDQFLKTAIHALDRVYRGGPEFMEALKAGLFSVTLLSASPKAGTLEFWPTSETNSVPQFWFDQLTDELLKFIPSNKITTSLPLSHQLGISQMLRNKDFVLYFTRWFKMVTRPANDILTAVRKQLAARWGVPDDHFLVQYGPDILAFRLMRRSVDPLQKTVDYKSFEGLLERIKTKFDKGSHSVDMYLSFSSQQARRLAMTEDKEIEASAAFEFRRIVEFMAAGKTKWPAPGFWKEMAKQSNYSSEDKIKIMNAFRVYLFHKAKMGAYGHMGTSQTKY